MKILYAHEGTNCQDHMFLKFLLDRGHETHLVSFSSVSSYSGSQGSLKPNFQGLPEFDELKIHHFDTARIRAHAAPVSIPFTGAMVCAFYDAINITILSLLLRRIKPDILNGHWLPTYGFYSAMARYHPFLLTVWGSDILMIPKISHFTRKIVEFTLDRADSVMVDSIVQERAAVELGCDPSKIVRFPWAVDLDMFNPSVSGEMVRTELGWERNPIVFFARWHMQVYGLEHLLNAVPEIILEHADARFMIGGCGPQTDEFKDLVAKKGLEKFVKFLGKIPYVEMPEYMAACDIYVSPSLSDGTSAALLEAMACGKPVVVSDIPANNEWIENGENGLIVPTKDSSAIASAIVSLLNDRKLRTTFGRRNPEIVRKKADLQKSLKKYEKTMLELTK